MLVINVFAPVMDRLRGISGVRRSSSASIPYFLSRLKYINSLPEDIPASSSLVDNTIFLYFPSIEPSGPTITVVKNNFGPALSIIGPPTIYIDESIA